ncbi:glycoside hydrolase family 6 protein [Demequina sp. SYSU T00068]|uniref:glycoside hydrolase family 6 protein n=1 Tax=Demequina lignilytica TaxID=3051663 RepID=UPI002618E4BD|nr:glycoside hydrolase family 6 protein [Demequina sp. SYSU T00068]MDN4491705.1 glycoside hydrolase family 6 protein [Demequina sp. SYSU T00068]
MRRRTVVVLLAAGAALAACAVPTSPGPINRVTEPFVGDVATLPDLSEHPTSPAPAPTASPSAPGSPAVPGSPSPSVAPAPSGASAEVDASPSAAPQASSAPTETSPAAAPATGAAHAETEGASASSPRATEEAEPPAASSPSSSPAVTPPASASGAFYDAPNAADTAVANLKAAGRDADAALIARIASQPAATWIGAWNGDVTATVSAVTSSAAATDTIALLAVYNIPNLDCAGSGSGASESGYLPWIDTVAAGMNARATTWVILEPDALVMADGCGGADARMANLAGAAERLDAAGAEVFLDAGHSGWRSPVATAELIRRVGVAHLAGFATNTSNYQSLASERAWGDQVSAAVGLPYVTDTSRNGNGPNGEWCNARGRALGAAPAVNGANLASGSGMAATVWAKVPGESDGTCNGGPPAGQWWEDVALELARNAG